MDAVYGNKAQAYINRAQAREIIGDREGAQADFAKAAELKPK
jgi:hypothetical protein